MRLDGRALPHHHSSAAAALGTTPSKGLTGTHGRADVDLEVTTAPFAEIVALPAAMRYVLGLIGPECTYSSAGGMIQTLGAEGFILHNGGNPDGTKPEDTIDHRRWHFYRWQTSERPWLQMRTGELSINYALTSAGGGRGGFVAIAGSHKGNLPAPLELRRLESAASAAVTSPELMPGDAVIFTEACAHGTGPWMSDVPRRALLYRYMPSYLAINGRGVEPSAATLEPAAMLAADALLALPGPAALSLHKAMLEPPWVSSKEPGYAEGARPDVGALVEAATAERQRVAGGVAAARL